MTGLGIVFSLTYTYMQRKRKLRKGGSHSATLSLLRKELREGNLQSLFGGSSCIVSSSNIAADPLLSSFILPMTDDFVSAQPPFSIETVSTKKSSAENVSERYVNRSLPTSLYQTSLSNLINVALKKNIPTKMLSFFVYYIVFEKFK